MAVAYWLSVFGLDRDGVMKFNLLASASTLAMGGLAALALPEPARAGLICSSTSCTETVSAAVAKTDFTNDPVTLDQFQPGAGQTLKSVVLSDSSNFSAVGSLKNTSNSPQNFIFQAGLGLKLSAGTGSPPLPFLYASGSISPQSYTLAAGQSTPYNFSNSFSSNKTTIMSNLSGFTGSSTFQTLFNGNATTTFNGGGNNVQTNLTTTASPELTITYNYTQAAVSPIPEPLSMAVLGSGLAGLGVMRRRRNKA